MKTKDRLNMFSKIRINPFIIFTIAAAFFLGKVTLILLGLISIFLHECAHALCAMLCGFKISYIEILPVGTLMRVEGLFEASSLCEIVIAIAGPIMSLILGTIFYYFYMINDIDLFKTLTLLNLSIAAFNLLPALPLDGGRIIRSIVSNFVGVRSATIFACMMGVMIGIAMFSYTIIAALQGKIAPAYIVFGLLLILSALEERKRAMFISIAQVTEKKETLTKQGSMMVSQIAVPEDIKLYTVVSRFKPRCYHMIVIVDKDMCPIGYLSEGEVVNAMIDKGAHILIGQLL